MKVIFHKKKNTCYIQHMTDIHESVSVRYLLWRDEYINLAGYDRNGIYVTYKRYIYTSGRKYPQSHNDCSIFPDTINN